MIRSTLTVALILFFNFSVKAQQIADTVFINGRVYTVNEQQPWAEAVAVRDGEIVHVGSSDSVKPLIGKGTKVIDLGDQMLLPGFIESHMHPLGAATLGNSLALESTETKEEWLADLADYANDNPDMKILLGYGFDAYAFGPQGPSKADLDAVVSDRPVVLLDVGLHSLWVNSATLEQAGITRDTPDPKPGLEYYRRDAQGEPTGWVIDTYDPLTNLKDFESFFKENFAASSEDFFAFLNSFGITTVFEASAGPMEEGLFAAVKSYADKTQLPVRLVAATTLNSHRLDTIVTDYQAMQEVYKDTDRFRVGAIKIHLDGTVETRNAALTEPFLDEPDNKGALTFAPSELNPVVSAADAAGIDLHIHTIGDAAVSAALDAIELAREQNGERDTRHTLTHLDLVQDKDFPRFKELDVILQTTPSWHTHVEGTVVSLGAKRANNRFRFRDAIDEGVRVTFSSDFPSNPLQGLPPLNNIEMGHTRRELGRLDTPMLGDEREKLAVATLVRGYTIDAAYQLRMEDKVGSIEVGKRADLIVLSDNLFDVPGEAIHKIDVEMTMLDGEVIYERPFYQWLIEWYIGL